MRLLDSGATHLGLDRLISEPTALAKASKPDELMRLLEG